MIAETPETTIRQGQEVVFIVAVRPGGLFLGNHRRPTRPYADCPDTSGPSSAENRWQAIHSLPATRSWSEGWPALGHFPTSNKTEGPAPWRGRVGQIPGVHRHRLPLIGNWVQSDDVGLRTNAHGLRRRKKRAESAIGRSTEEPETPDTRLQLDEVGEVADSSTKPGNAAGHWSTH